MIKNKKIILFGALILLILTSCKQGFFKKVRIKASPELRLNLGTREIKLSDFISEKKINEEIKKMGDGLNKLKVYEYSPKEHPQDLHYLMHFPVFDIDLNMNENFEAIKKINDGLSSGLKETEFKVPKINQSKSLTIPLDINDTILKSFNKSGNIPLSFPSVEYEMEMPIPNPIEISFEDSFSSLTFGTPASLKFSIAAEDASPSFKILITNAELKKMDGTLISSYTGAAETAEVDLSNKTIPNKCKMYLSFKTQGGEPGHSFTPKLKREITGKIKRVDGIKLGPIEHTISTTSIELGANNFDSAKISEGNIKYSISLPSGLTGFTISPFIQISQGNGGLNCDMTALASEQTKDLAGKTINNQNINISGKINISANGAVYEYTDNMDAKVKFDVNINKFEWVKLKMAEDFKLEYNYAQDITEIKKWVKKIEFNELSSKIKLENSLPLGNDISIKLSSNSFGVDSGFQTFQADIPAGITETEMFTRKNFPLDLSGINEFDFKAEIQFPNYNKDAKILTLNNIEGGAVYKFGGTLELKADWKEAIIKPGDAGALEDSYPNGAEPIKFKLLNDYPGLKNLRFKPIKGYFYLNSDIIKGSNPGLNAEMNLSMLYGKDNTGIEEPLASSNNINFVDKLPDFTGTSPENYQIPHASINIDDLKINNLIENGANQLKFKYKFKLNEVKVEKAQIEGQKNTKLRADILFDIPMLIKVENNIEYKTEIPDILFRQEAQTNTNQNNSKEILDMVQKIELVIDYNNQIGAGLKVELVNKDWTDGGGISKFKKEINLEKGSGNIHIALTAEELKYIQENQPFKLDIKFTLPKGDYSLEKDGKLHFQAYTLLKTDVDKEFNR